MRWLLLGALCLAPQTCLSAQTLDSVRAYQSLRVDSTLRWYTRRDTLRDTIRVASAPSEVRGIPFGSWECTAPNLGPFTMCIRSAGSWIAGELTALRPVGGKLLLSQGGYQKFQNCATVEACKLPNADKRYNPTLYRAWVQSLKPYVPSWQTYLLTGTLIGVQVIDDIGTTNWGGVAITKQQVEDMAHWWKEIMPSLPTYVREKATGLTGFPWVALDGSITQYNARYMGDITLWRDSNVVAAKQAKLGLMLSLNVLAGGKIVPGCYHGGSLDTCSMSADELLRYGLVQLATPESCGQASWKFDGLYQRQPGVSETLRLLGGLAAVRAATGCRAR